MTTRQYVYLILLPYALLAGATALALAWSGQQEATLQAHDRVVMEAIAGAREQCIFDAAVGVKIVIPSICKGLLNHAQTDEGP